jgi:hypothetical protein
MRAPLNATRASSLGSTPRARRRPWPWLATALVTEGVGGAAPHRTCGVVPQQEKQHVRLRRRSTTPPRTPTTRKPHTKTARGPCSPPHHHHLQHAFRGPQARAHDVPGLLRVRLRSRGAAPSMRKGTGPQGDRPAPVHGQGDRPRGTMRTTQPGPAGPTGPSRSAEPGDYRRRLVARRWGTGWDNGGPGVAATPSRTRRRVGAECSLPEAMRRAGACYSVPAPTARGSLPGYL